MTAKAKADNGMATFDKLISKHRAEQKVVIALGEDEDVELLFRAIGYKAYDKMITDCPPTTSQKADGSIYNPNKFGPALLASVCVDPDMTIDQWSEIWTSDEWSKGEVTQIFVIAGELCNKGLDIPK